MTYTHHHDRAALRAAAVRIIKKITSLPPYSTLNTRRDTLAPPTLNAFRHLEPIGWGLNDDDWWVFAPEDCPPPVLWPMDTAFVVSKEYYEDSEFCMSHIRSIASREARGVADRFSRYMVRFDHAREDYGKLLTGSMFFSWIGNKWVISETRHDAVVENSIEPRIATAVALRQRYEWAVALGFDGSPSIRFATDPTGIKDLWRVRDIPEGRDRRPALEAWVLDHWRQDRYDPEMEIYVRKHLRGATLFTWRDMVGEILPSQYDIEKRDQLILERKKMREMGLDRRVKESAT